ncbi:MAG: 3-deoxy-8-phosphooctulonate synthase [Candidatus Omnitrophica bacterium]|nr:3-deoxy-8-phosphooctulonate synthase [Candidatus Omnitrophota bacterium]MDD5236151.1 3-deoxy-8-phosphooctulonate synthase [Candidatus Omnitrophota bacterium]MDD5611350.1 3-deoxy-8-phosphooctulonate synthase [Candidatus Omnitrophota bacterium]
MTKIIDIGRIKVGGGKGIVLIAGPCVIESAQMCLSVAARLKTMAKALGMPFIFKASYDKANRTSLESFRGPGLVKGLEILKKVKKDLGIPILSDVHCREEIAKAKSVLDIIQIPAFLCRQTDFVLDCAKTGLAINIKKGQFLAPWDIAPIIKKIESTGNRRIIITERGFTFGYNNLVSDFRSLKIIQDLGYPVIYDATHSVQLPSGKGCSSGGERRFVPALTRAAVAFGCDGIFLETHPKPEEALCDGPNSVSLTELEKLLKEVKKIQEVLK